MVFNNSDESDQSGSIFNSPELNEPYAQPYYVNQPQPQQGSGLVDMFNNFVDKFIDEPKKKKELLKLQKEAQDKLGEHEEILKIFYNYGCNLKLYDGYMIVEYPPLNLMGSIKFTENGAEFDENANKIMEQLAKLLTTTNEFGSQMDNYEQEEFYPVGELEQVTIKLNGEEVKARCGTLMNKQGETKKVYYYKGKEVKPDGE